MVRDANQQDSADTGMSQVFTFRLGTDEFHQLTEQARAAGETVSQYLRKAVKRCMTVSHPVYGCIPTVSWTISTPHLTSSRLMTWSEGTRIANVDYTVRYA